LVYFYVFNVKWFYMFNWGELVLHYIFVVQIKSMSLERIRMTIFILFLWTCSVACGQKGADKSMHDDEASFEQLEQRIVGAWKNKSIMVEVNGYHDSDTSFVVDINEDNWSIKMDVKPFVTVLRDDGTYTGKQLDTDGNVIANPSGMWAIDGDTLILEDSKDNIYRYQVLVEENNAIFKAWIDYDGDGKSDDLYKGIQQRINTTKP